LPTELQRRGAIVDEIQIYDSVRAELNEAGLDRLRQGIDVVTFTSPSTALAFFDLAAEAGLDPCHLPGDPLIACIGPITASAAVELGFRVGLTATEYTARGLALALADSFQEANHRVGS
jgi:uroporphyrinogen-III synthase